MISKMNLGFAIIAIVVWSSCLVGYGLAQVLQQNVVPQCSVVSRLGVEDGSIPDRDLTASSGTASNGRLVDPVDSSNFVLWTPTGSNKGVANNGEYIQVFLGGCATVTGLVIQGGIDTPGASYPVEIQAQYWDASALTPSWKTVQDGALNAVIATGLTGLDVFSAPGTILFPEAVLTTGIRIFPYTVATSGGEVFTGSPTMRFDVEGCRFSEVAACVSNIVLQGTLPDSISLSWDTATQECLADMYQISYEVSNVDQCFATVERPLSTTLDWQEGNTVALENLIPYTTYTITVTGGVRGSTDTCDTVVFTPGASMVVMENTQEVEWKRVKRLPPCSILEALSKYLDITTPPTPDFLRMLASYAKAPHERDYIKQMGKGGIDYKTWISASHPHLAEVLILYPSVNVPAWFLLDHLPLLTPRYYSISSCPRVHQNEIHITVAVVKYWAQGSEQSFPPGSFHKGVCSSWLEELRFGELVPVYIKKAASFHFPSDTTKPVLLVGNGTGIAPFRSFWQRRKLQMALSKQHHRKITLVFGCRHPKVDDIYRDETSAAEKSGALTKVLTAYSRVPGKPKKYVQDIIKETPDLICKHLLEEEGHIYVCGDNIMAVDVRKTLVHTLGSKGNMTEAEAEDYINNMRESGRYHEDLFGVVIRLPEEKPKVTQTQRFTFISVVDLVKSKLFQNYTISYI